MNSYDAIIVGGGIIGGSLAFELARRNLRVAILDRQEPGLEASWAAAGMLSPAPDCAAAIPLVPLARASMALYPQFVADIEDASKLPVGFRADGTIELLFQGNAEQELSTLVTLHHGLGLACEPLSPEEAQAIEPHIGRNAIAAALLPDEGSVDARALTAAVLSAAKFADAIICPDVTVTSVAREGNRCTGVKTSKGETIFGGTVILAAGCWTSTIGDISAIAPTQPVRGQMVALGHAGGKPIRHTLRSDHGYIVPRDFDNPQKLVAGATLENTGYEKAVTSGGLEKILSAVNELAPELARAEIVETWSGLRPGTPDQLPIIGPTDVENLLMATGHYRNGILLAPVTAKLLAEWITERRTYLNWNDFSPLRFASSRVETDDSCGDGR